MVLIAGALATGLALGGQIQVSAADPSPGIDGPNDPAIIKYRESVDALIEGFTSSSPDDQLSGAGDLIEQIEAANGQLQQDLRSR
jgi:hypothetical protein